MALVRWDTAEDSWEPSGSKLSLEWLTRVITCALPSTPYTARGDKEKHQKARYDDAFWCKEGMVLFHYAWIMH